jgi:hypothetical protein
MVLRMLHCDKNAAAYGGRATAGNGPVGEAMEKLAPPPLLGFNLKKHRYLSVATPKTFCGNR